MSDSLDQIAAEVNNCKACELYKNSIRKVFGEGSKNPRVIFCGEAPGAEEIAVGLLRRPVADVAHLGYSDVPFPVPEGPGVEE